MIRGGKDSLYDILGVHRASNAKDIERAYQKLRAEAEKDAAPPDRMALLREAHEVLSDAQRRARYDASLRSDEFLRPGGPKVPSAVKWAPLGVVVVAAFVGLWFLFRPSGETERIPAEILAAAVPAVGRVHLIELSGRATPYGNAFAIDQGVMIAPCPEKRANTQLVVRFGTRNAPAQISRADPQRNLCRLNVVSGGSWPLEVASAPAKEGDKVYAVTTAVGSGETIVTDMRVSSLLLMDGGKGVELSEPVNPYDAGGPLIDSRGRVVGMVVTQHKFTGKSVAIPLEWIRAIRAAPR
jgi:hypothetical protein